MMCYQTNKPLFVTADASKDGIGYITTLSGHFRDKGLWRQRRQSFPLVNQTTSSQKMRLENLTGQLMFTHIGKAVQSQHTLLFDGPPGGPQTATP